MPTPTIPRSLSRRGFLTAIGAAGTLAALSGCSSSSGRETVRFTFSKREAIEYMTQVVADYNASQSAVLVEIDTSGVDVVSASFVRGNPPDLMLANYNMEVARFVQRCVLTDLSDTDAASRINPDLQPLMDQYGTCAGTTPALPYSIMAASVIYNKSIFEEHGLEVPETWSALIEVCDTLQDAGVTPFYATFKDAWTVNQGWTDYSVGGSLDVIDFFDRLAEEGDAVGADSAVSFQKDFTPPLEKMMELTAYVNEDAASRGYNDGNLAFAQGKAAMYLQGPWAFSEIAKTDPDLELGTFPLPMTEDPADLKVRVNTDLAAMIPTGSNHQEAARDFLEYLFQPEIIEGYNASQLGFTPLADSAAPDDPRVEGMIEHYNAGRFYQGPGVLVPKTIPMENYMQSIILGSNPESVLSTIDADWARLAFRAPAQSSTSEGSAS